MSRNFIKRIINKLKISYFFTLFAEILYKITWSSYFSKKMLRKNKKSHNYETYSYYNIMSASNRSRQIVIRALSVSSSRFEIMKWNPPLRQAASLENKPFIKNDRHLHLDFNIRPYALLLDF